MGITKNGRKRSRSDSEDATVVRKAGQDSCTAQATKKAKVEDRRSIFVRSLPPSATNESLADYFSQHYPVKHAVVVVDQKTKESRGFGFVTFADVDDAKAAKQALDKKDWDGRRIRVDVAEPRQRNAADSPSGASSIKPSKSQEAFSKPPKLIVRNLPWSIKTSDQLAKLFISFGKVKFADLPQTKGKLKGFGFVTIRGKPNAEKAIEAINGKVVDGRNLSVDWAVDKETWDNQHNLVNQTKDAECKEDEKNGQEEVDDDVDDDDDEDDAESVQGSDASSTDSKSKNRDDQLDSDLANFMKNHLQNMEDEDDKDDNEDEVGSKNGEEALTDPAKPKREMMTDNSSTVFVRNLPFTTTDEQLKSFFGHFGNVRYARVVIHKATERPAGTGFVCFADKAVAKSCIIGAPLRAAPVNGVKHSVLQDENSDPNGEYTLDGRVLQVVQAVGKQEASTLAENSLATKREKDKRKLYLLAEGSIAASSSLFGLLTDAEVKMRQTSAVQRKKLVQKNPMLHVSLTRLALRNLPRNIESKELKELARKAVVRFAQDVKEGRRQPLSKEENARDGKDAKEKEKERKSRRKGIVRQAKIVFEDSKGSKVPEASGAGKSRGYGFIEYMSHRHALMGLRYLNGLQLEGDNGKKQRLIVEFAIENAQVVKRRQEAEAKAAKSTQTKRKDNEAATSVTEQGGDMWKGKKQQRDKKSTKGADKEPAVEEGNGKRPTMGEKAMQHRLIARTRLMRKKKAAFRGKA